jgi:hypothetical protein
MRSSTEAVLAKSAYWSEAVQALQRRVFACNRATCELPGIDALRHFQLAQGAIHEWFTDERSVWIAPLSILIHVVRQTRGRVMWIGRRVWPYPRGLAVPLLARSIFVDAPGRDERVWAIDLALRSAAVGAVVGDGAGLSMAESRRLQLAAGSGRGLGLVARPLKEVRELSAAQTRWVIRPEPSKGGGEEPCWSVELLRCKGLSPVPEEGRRWVVRRDHETGDVGVVPQVPARSVAAAGAGA